MERLSKAITSRNGIADIIASGLVNVGMTIFSFLDRIFEID